MLFCFLPQGLTNLISKQAQSLINMPRSPCLAHECQDLRNELSRARRKISIMKKEKRRYEGMLETRDSDVGTTA